MTRVFALVAAAVVTLSCTSAEAQIFNRFDSYQRFTSDFDRYRSDRHRDDRRHDDRYRARYSGGHLDAPVHQCSVAELERLADQLAEVARHLHDDAYQLSRGYERTHAIIGTVSKLERLQEHMHRVLRDAARSRYASSSLISHVAADMNEARSLMLSLHSELRRQGYHGACPQDLVAIKHMQRVITDEALPLLQRMELTLYGSTHHDVLPSRHDVHASSRYPVESRRTVKYPTRRTTTRLSLPGFSIQF